ncbi:MAG: lipoprotein [Gammaproteobacteria bacterium]|nr:lipoprotein [Gammaproteobacteria bacterium]
MRFLCITAVAAALLCGCGQKGPLILPDRHPHPAVPTTPRAPASAAPVPQAGAPKSR